VSSSAAATFLSIAFFQENEESCSFTSATISLIFFKIMKISFLDLHQRSDFINSKDHVCAIQVHEENFMINNESFINF
jgi:hypothetical protein